MPEPQRTSHYPAMILGEEQTEEGAVKPEGAEIAGQLCGGDAETASSFAPAPEEPSEQEAEYSIGRPANPFPRDLRDRDLPPRRNWGPAVTAWTAAPLVKYLKRVAMQIDTNVKNKRIPTKDRLDAFVSKLIKQSKHRFKDAPKKVRHTVQQHFIQQFHTYWDVVQNTKVKDVTPEELKWSLVSLIESLASALKVNPEALE